MSFDETRDCSCWCDGARCAQHGVPGARWGDGWGDGSSVPFPAFARRSVVQAQALLDAPPVPERATLEYAFAARSTLERELVRALHEARVIQYACIHETANLVGGAAPGAALDGDYFGKYDEGEINRLLVRAKDRVRR